MKTESQTANAIRRTSDADHLTSERSVLRRLIFVSAILAVLPLSAQSAANFDTKTLAPKSSPGNKAADKKEAAGIKAAKETAAVNVGPSRYVAEADLASYVQTLSSAFSMRGRSSDPFGLLQDPDAKPVMKSSVAKSPHRVAPVQSIPFSDVIAKIKVTTIMPGEKRFLIDNRSYKQGGRLPIIHRGKPISAEIVAVNSRQIDFRNAETGESASLRINMLPVGMTPGTHGKITAPGMVPDLPDSPLNLDNGNP